MPDVWLSGRAVGVSDPWPSAELGPEERAACYGPEAAERYRSLPRSELARLILARLAESPATVVDLEAELGHVGTVRGLMAGLSRHGAIVRVTGDRRRWQIVPTRGRVAPSDGIATRAPGCP